MTTDRPQPGFGYRGIEDAEFASKQPIYLDFESKDYGTEERQQFPRFRKTHWHPYRGPLINGPRTMLMLVLPVLIFNSLMTLLSFGWHFRRPMLCRCLTALLIIPAIVTTFAIRRSVWQRLGEGLILFATIFAVVAGELNYWHFNQPFFFLESLKTYSNVDPLEVDGVRLMDAGKVHFAEGSRLELDMGMSFTSWDVYCVVPITKNDAMSGAGAMLETYDMWAVGVNCCRSGDTNFHCGEWDNRRARSGLRQTSEAQRNFFRLAVSQAEAAYGIRSPHPVFFYWVEDPQREESFLFQEGFRNWIYANFMHLAINTFVVVMFILVVGRPKQAAIDEVFT